MNIFLRSNNDCCQPKVLPPHHHHITLQTHTCTNPPSHTHSLEHEDLSDDEVWEIVEDEVSEEEEEEEEEGATALPSHRRKVVSPDSSLKPSARLRLYDNPEWRMEVGC